MDFKKLYGILFIIPAIAAFFIALIPTLKYQWPLGWDIIFHVHIAQLYSSHGLVFTDPLLNAPFGQKINYPPLFHLFLASLGILSKADYFQIARFLQPVLTFSIVLSVSYVARKFYGLLAGVSAGFLLLSSILLQRLVLPLPENLALIFLPLAVYIYYLSVRKENYKLALIAGSIFGIVALIHQAATLCLFLAITISTVVIGLIDKNLRIFKNFSIFMAVGVAIAFIWWAPAILNTLSPSGGAGGGVLTSIVESKSLSILSYLGSFGPLILIFALVGGIIALKKRRKKDLFLISWITIIFLLSKAYLVGINVISYRLLVYLLLPLSMLGGLGLSYLYTIIKKRIPPSRKNEKLYSCIPSIFLIVIFIISMIFGVLTMESPRTSTFGAESSFGKVKIAPPSSSELDTAAWFQKNSDKNKIMATSNYYSGMLIVAVAGQPDIGVSEFYLTGKANKSNFTQKGIGYLVYDKRLNFSSSNGTPYMVETNGQFIFFNIYKKDLKAFVPYNTQLVYENEDFMIFEVKL